MTSKDLIQQYVDTGIKISEYQFNQLNNNLRTTYLRKRLMVGKLDDYEILMLPYDKRTAPPRSKLDSKSSGTNAVAPPS